MKIFLLLLALASVTTGVVAADVAGHVSPREIVETYQRDGDLVGDKIWKAKRITILYRVGKRSHTSDGYPFIIGQDPQNPGWVMGMVFPPEATSWVADLTSGSLVMTRCVVGGQTRGDTVGAFCDPRDIPLSEGK
ncbi:hypothetical protein G3N57_02785 [Paraburkholderia sp. Se-20369]|nr:hypothetical protein [Paraburkholderia sp. Se-20369]